MSRKRSLGRVILAAVCLLLAGAWLVWRLVLHDFSGRMTALLQTECGSIVRLAETLALQKKVLARKLAWDAADLCASGDFSACLALPEHFIASYDAALSAGLFWDKAAFPGEDFPPASYAFRDSGQTVTVSGSEAQEALKALPSVSGEGPVWTPFWRNPVTSAPSVSAVCPVLLPGRGRIGLAESGFNTFELHQLLLSRGLPPELLTDILDGSGTVLASSRPEAMMRPAARDPVLAELLEAVLGREAGVLTLGEGQDEVRLVFETAPGTGWKICIRSKAAEDAQNVSWFWENDTRVYSCCGFHTVRKTQNPLQSVQASGTAKPGKDADRKGRLFFPPGVKK